MELAVTEGPEALRAKQVLLDLLRKNDAATAAWHAERRAPAGTEAGGSVDDGSGSASGAGRGDASTDATTTLAATADRPPIDIVERKLELETLSAGQYAAQLFGILTPEECEAAVAWSEAAGYTTLEGIYPKHYRSNWRVIIDAPDVADIVFERIRGTVPSEYQFDAARPTRSDAASWVAASATRPDKPDATSVGLNERFRFCRYTEGGHFNSHVDANFRRSATEGSKLTFMIYLNTIPEGDGGTTNFLRFGSDEPLSNGTVRPEAGMALVFDHNLNHMGCALGGGAEAKKYLMRSDVMYRLKTEASGAADRKSKNKRTGAAAAASPFLD